MSAYIVSKKHVVFLVTQAALQRYRHGAHAFSWYWGNPGQRGELAPGDFERAARVAGMLWAENVRSVSARYPGDKTNELPGPVGEDFVILPSDFEAFPPAAEPVAVLKAINCLDYQSCEHDGWKNSEAFAFLEALKSAAIAALPGYYGAKWSL